MMGGLEVLLMRLNLCWALKDDRFKRTKSPFWVEEIEQRQGGVKFCFSLNMMFGEKPLLAS